MRHLIRAPQRAGFLALSAVLIGAAGTLMPATANAQSLGIRQVTIGATPGSLTRALAQANTSGVPTVILLLPGTYATGSAPWDISGQVTLATVPSAAPAVVTGDHASQIFEVQPGATLNLRDVMVENGQLASGDGGAIINRGTLSAIAVTFSDNVAMAGSGGAVANEGTMQLQQVAFVTNEAFGPQGGPGQYAGGGGGGGLAMGGAVFNAGGGVLTGAAVQWSGNVVVGGAGGASHYPSGHFQGAGGVGGGTGGAGGVASYTPSPGSAGGFGAGGGGGGGCTPGGSGGAGSPGGLYGGAGGQAYYSGGGGGGGGAGLGGALANDGGRVTLVMDTFWGNEVRGGPGGEGAGGSGDGQPGAGLGPNVLALGGVTQVTLAGQSAWAGSPWVTSIPMT